MIPIRPDLVGHQPYGAAQLDAPIVLNVNENPYPPSPEISREMGQAITKAGATLNRYPDREAIDLRRALAEYLGKGIQSENVWVANGSNEIMQQLCQAFGGPGRKLLTFEPTYSMYPQYARTTFTEYVRVERRADYEIDEEKLIGSLTKYQPAIAVLARPNNPTGTGLSLELIAEAADNSSGLIVVDEAYQEFSTAPSAVELLAKTPNLVVCRTMSKAFALAGARVGYLAASAEIVDACRLVRLPYHLSAQSQAVALVALRHAEEMLNQVALLASEARSFESWLRARGYSVSNSEANFTMFGKFLDRHQVWQELLAKGILVRETGPDGYLRASAGTPQQMLALRSALEDIDPKKE